MWLFGCFGILENRNNKIFSDSFGVGRGSREDQKYFMKMVISEEINFSLFVQ
jgi:hypothetical protein